MLSFFFSAPLSSARRNIGLLIILFKSQGAFWNLRFWRALSFGPKNVCTLYNTSKVLEELDNDNDDIPSKPHNFTYYRLISIRISATV